MCQAAVDHTSSTDPMSSAHVSRNRFNNCHISSQQLLLKSARVLHVTSIDIKASPIRENEVSPVVKWVLLFLCHLRYAGRQAQKAGVLQYPLTSSGYVIPATLAHEF